VGYSEVLYNSERKEYGQVIDISERKVYETRDNELLISFKLLVERYAEYYEKYNIDERTREYYNRFYGSHGNYHRLFWVMPFHT
jgi:hypothetical protein